MAFYYGYVEIEALDRNAEKVEKVLVKLPALLAGRQILKRMIEGAFIVGDAEEGVWLDDWSSKQSGDRIWRGGLLLMAIEGAPNNHILGHSYRLRNDILIVVAGVDTPKREEEIPRED